MLFTTEAQRIPFSWRPVGSDLRADRICGEVVGSGAASFDGPLGDRTLPEILQKSLPLGQSVIPF
jgi:hypothetical protein